MTVVLYTKEADPYSVRAKSMLRMKGVAFTEKHVSPEELQKLFGTTITPQIVINGKHIGSFDQLGSLELQGKLDELLE
jgi:glutaredoxin 3